MSREVSIDALLIKARAQVDQIRRGYKASLHARKIDPALCVDIKNACENLRSALDYLAADICERHCPCAARGRSPYFPILPDQATFDRRLDESFPGLRQAAPALVAELEALQPYRRGQEWLGQLNRVNNENKHGDLVEQTRIEFKETTVARGSASMTWRDGVTFGPGVSILGAPIDSKTQLPVAGFPVAVKQVVWVDFRFRDIDVSALGLLEQSVSGVAAIVAKVEALLEPGGPTSVAT